MALDFLTASNPASTNASGATQTTLPDWYNSYIQGIAGKATDIASNPYQAYPGERIADFNDDQQGAFQQIRNNQGSYLPDLNTASDTLGTTTGQVQGALGQVAGAVNGATSAVAGPAQSWVDPGVADKYMSPYTKNVTDEIARLGNQNLTQNIIPSVESNFVGSGQFGSSRNAQILAQNVRDAQLGITGLQSQALQTGYNNAESTFGADANRAQTQGQLQANTGLGAGQVLNQNASIAGSTGVQLGAQQGALGSLRQSLGNTDATALGAVGGQQQALEQQGYDKSYQDFLNQQNWDWTQLGKVQNAVSGVQLPTGTTTAGSTTQSPAGTSPLSWVNALSGLANASNSTATPTQSP